ncbi:unnamed protein product, partial [marine sediment metagenome]
MDKWGKTIFYIFTDYSDYFGLSLNEEKFNLDLKRRQGGYGRGER